MAPNFKTASFPPHPGWAVWTLLGGLFRGAPVSHLFLHFSLMELIILQ